MTAVLDWSHPAEIPFARTDRDGSAIVDERRSLTSGEFADEVRRLAGGFAALGVGRGDAVGTMIPNR
jgi:acyl-CoA synthetase (AMP-forming)/AMP-acid ligase II